MHAWRANDVPIFGGAETPFSGCFRAIRRQIVLTPAVRGLLQRKGLIPAAPRRIDCLPMPRLLSSVRLAAPLAEVFAFFADARNLQALTPPFLRFEVLTLAPIEMRAGALIDYRLRVHGLPLRWRSEITVWDPPSRFVDEQRRGPYRAWRHEHRFTAEGDGTRVDDEVSYEVLGGGLVDRLFVRRDLDRIFAFRREALLRRFRR